MVGAPGFKPGTSCAQGRRAIKLRYAPTGVSSNGKRCFLFDTKFSNLTNITLFVILAPNREPHIKNSRSKKEPGNMKTEPSSSTTKSGWTKVAQYLFRYEATDEIFARFRVHGKIVRVATGQTMVANATLKLRDLMKDESDRSAQADPSMSEIRTFGGALAVMKCRIL